eukprot:TRINITY_DN19203_c0_g1_i1.p1 TRINITY_DN19203_c0_g1~~TRINITY_DN19203_c0_g1_i1.p1  ORF type:complete len:166 (+),score=53.70 TRINITY_DN19203_c0_g1_i1:172-669(+)
MNREIVRRKAGLRDEDIEELVKPLCGVECCTAKVDLSYNTALSDIGVFYLARALRRNASVKTVALDGIHLTDRGLDVISKALEENDTLTSLSIKGTQVTAAGIESLSRSLALHNKSLSQLHTCRHLPRCTGLARAARGSHTTPQQETGTTSWLSVNIAALRDGGA